MFKLCILEAGYINPGLKDKYPPYSDLFKDFLNYKIRNWNVSFNDTGYFTTEVKPVGRDTSSTTYTGTITGTGLLGTVNLEDGDYTFAVQSENDKLSVTIKNDSHLPSNFINASWQGYYVTATSRV